MKKMLMAALVLTSGTASAQVVGGALNQLKVSAPTGIEIVEPTIPSSKPVDQPESIGYAWMVRNIPNGIEYSGKYLPTISQVDVQITIDGKPVKIDFIGDQELPPTAMVLQGEGETLTVDLENLLVTGTMSGESLSATSADGEAIISYGERRFQMNIGMPTISLTSLQVGDVPGPVRRFAAYLLIMLAQTKNPT